MLIFHIVLPSFWENFKNCHSYEAESLHAEGFIHCSYEHQLESVLERYYKNAGTVLILSIETGKLQSKLAEEPSTDNEIYPHIYGKLNIDAIIDVAERKSRNTTGRECVLIP